MIVNPEYETANEISRIIRFPSAANLDSFAGGKIEIARIRIHSDNMLCDMPLYDLRKKCKANGDSQAAIVKKAIEQYLDEKK
jgi:trk system potassium uptake protein TrkA